MTGEEDLPARRREVFAVLDALMEFWALHPELRLGQIVENARKLSQSTAATFYLEDDDLLRGLRLQRDMHHDTIPWKGTTE